MFGKVKFKWFLFVPIFTSLFVIIILSISWADKINEKINSPINEVGIEVELKGFLKHLKKKLPKKIDDLTIFIDAEAKGSNLSFYYQILSPAKKLNKKETEQSVNNYFFSTVCENKNARFLLENGRSVSYIYKDINHNLVLALGFGIDDCNKKAKILSDLSRLSLGNSEFNKKGEE